MIDLSKDQLQDTIDSLLNKDQGLNELLEMILDGLMKLEGDTFLSQHACAANKANGYRPAGQPAMVKSTVSTFPQRHYVVLGLTEDMQREVLAIACILSESACRWEELLNQLLGPADSKKPP